MKIQVEFKYEMQSMSRFVDYDEGKGEFYVQPVVIASVAITYNYDVSTSYLVYRLKDAKKFGSAIELPEYRLLNVEDANAEADRLNKLWSERRR